MCFTRLSQVNDSLISSTMALHKDLWAKREDAGERSEKEKRGKGWGVNALALNCSDSRECRQSKEHKMDLEHSCCVNASVCTCGCQQCQIAILPNSVHMPHYCCCVKERVEVYCVSMHATTHTVTQKHL